MRITEDMIGTYRADGSVAKWPLLAVDGRPFRRAEGGFSQRPIDDGRFVVVTGTTPANVELDIAVTFEGDSVFESSVTSVVNWDMTPPEDQANG